MILTYEVHCKNENGVWATVLFCCNTDVSEKVELTVIGANIKSQCLLRAGQMPRHYDANKKALDDSMII